ncbi:putative nucleolar ribosomal biogenesis factor RPF1p [Dimargaris cristalligena]|uniref:Putative nucleolar ribosomal biogenesis factor RPF1p n=1 Tax=Dimargaris cristalligena TaxID=215637 RepID=A0A4P9ZZ40_9FUNG|nr:putative nucleolar ribosomal biogenesis factor RPF1p [Dimargaris cristalligena]|eukprot:RKP38242.1 putative nucleolar ribosomal biogenesis factor RPF1p [Dimargaris cristalligena]
MSDQPETPEVPRPQFNAIKNRAMREDVYRKYRHEKAKRKSAIRRAQQKAEKLDPSKKEERLAKNVSKTIDSTREHDDTIVDDNDEEDEFAPYFNGRVPKVLITTSTKSTKISESFGGDLATLFPNSTFIKRAKGYTIDQIVSYCNNRDFTDVIVIHEDLKTLHSMTIIHLPEGPTAHFKLSGIVSMSEILGKDHVTPHFPELILNNFNTRLGQTVGRFFAALFPQTPQFRGRQVATFHNQRDFIFFRRHRYEFQSEDKTSLQELGPRFTLKLKWLQKGPYDPTHGEYEWVFKSEMETTRRRFFL